ncbi:hypothetical protein CAC42_3670 [Sphaceloma murrayae]|uniref:Uncharacterized protein n=1 Tax=Sphaceloma murrayae TaxID=2082308 RepID=A0A2K1QQ98_9PEZI|nr:hypothetical protein CAC42_3670 [Sphaceloma murrayae]
MDAAKLEAAASVEMTAREETGLKVKVDARTKVALDAWNRFQFVLDVASEIVTRVVGDAGVVADVALELDVEEGVALGIEIEADVLTVVLERVEDGRRCD